MVSYGSDPRGGWVEFHSRSPGPSNRKRGSVRGVRARGPNDLHATEEKELGTGTGVVEHGRAHVGLSPVFVPGLWESPVLARPSHRQVIHDIAGPSRVVGYSSSAFYLGANEAHWLDKTIVPLFVSHNRLRRRKNLPRALGRWCLDSGAFSEISTHGRWKTSINEYVDAVYRYWEEIGGMDWAAPQDWMCEPHIIAKTGLTVDKHQELTVENYLALRETAPDLPFIPVLQGWTINDYVRCVIKYRKAGVDLREQPVVGLGSVCRRQGMDEAEQIVRLLHSFGLKLHGFGVKDQGLRRFEELLVSSDSMAWAWEARFRYPLPGHQHRSCTTCMKYALRWRERLLSE